jgi:hypothetical protein
MMILTSVSVSGPLSLLLEVEDLCGNFNGSMTRPSPFGPPIRELPLALEIWWRVVALAAFTTSVDPLVLEADWGLFEEFCCVVVMAETGLPEELEAGPPGRTIPLRIF